MGIHVERLGILSTIIIAEAGVNHNGSIKNAFKLIDIAKKAGADIVKFQTFKAEKVVSRYAQKAEYQKKFSNTNETQFEMLKKLELSYEQLNLISKYCIKKGIIFLSTPFDIESIDILERLNMGMYKIPSGEITNLPYLIKVASLGKPIILSTGMSSLDEIDIALNILKTNGAADVYVLHCNTQYPTPFEDVNLLAMNTIKNRFSVKVGYSDHTLGIEIPIAAVALGAQIIEKHFTLDKNMEGPDHKASLEPDELKKMIIAVRNIEKSIGNGIKKPSDSERKNMEVARKSIVAKTNIFAGEVFTEDNLTVKRPGNGISPMKWFEVLGKTANKNFKEDELITL
jgi:N,N'-diacetyllegionaminate synthase